VCRGRHFCGGHSWQLSGLRAILDCGVALMERCDELLLKQRGGGGGGGDSGESSPAAARPFGAGGVGGVTTTSG